MQAGTFDLSSAARAIAAAADADSKRTGRPCRLHDADAVLAFLSALLSGSTVSAAAAASSFSEAGVRRWLKIGTTAGAHGVYADLAAAVGTVRELRGTITAAPVVSPPVSAVRVPDAPAAPVVPTAPPSKVHEWKAALARATSLNEAYGWRTEGDRKAAAREAEALIARVQGEMRAFGFKSLQALPASAPSLGLPRNLSYGAVKAAYLSWWRSMGQEAPNEVQLEMKCWPWYYANQAPEPTPAGQVETEIACAK